MYQLRGGDLKCCPYCISVGSWNVEGLLDTKIVELERIMHDLGIHILCLQERNWAGADSFVIDGHYFVILSRGIIGVRDHAGVGFLISPEMRCYLIGLYHKYIYIFLLTHLILTISS